MNGRLVGNKDKEGPGDEDNGGPGRYKGDPPQDVQRFSLVEQVQKIAEERTAQDKKEKGF